jgi:hypothetical protein
MARRTNPADNRASAPLRVPPFALFALMFTIIWLLHAPLLRLPYFWDEAGYYVPAARDLWLHGQLIPTSTLSSGHPPLVMAWLAFWWKFSAFTPAMTRTAMLMVAAFGLLGVYRLAKLVANVPVAVAATALTAIYPVWFAQSSLAQLDVAAAAFTFWGLTAYLKNHRWRAAFLFALAGLSKETAIVAPLVICAWERIALAPIWKPRMGSDGQLWHISSLLPFDRVSWARSLALLVSAVPLAAWFIFHRVRTGVFFGNPEFFRYNVAATANPLRFLLALVQRFWHAFGYENLFVLTIAAGMAMLYSPLRETVRGDSGERVIQERPRIAITVQIIFAILIATYIVMLAAVGGAVIARYMLPVVPLVIILAVSTLRRRVSWWPWATVAVAATFVLALFVNPPYRISPEDNLTYADYVRLHKQAADIISSRYRDSRILTAWPASDELTRPWLGYVSSPMKVLRIDNFSLPQMELATQEASQYDVAYVFSTKLEPANPMFGAPFWQRLQERFFDYHRDVPPELAARMLGGRIIYQASRNGEWVAIIEIQHVQNVRLETPCEFGRNTTAVR